MKTVFIIDIDTTIADNSHRAALLEKQCVVCLAPVNSGHRAECTVCGSDEHTIVQKSWDTFLSPELVLKDTPDAQAQKAIKRMRELGMEFHFLTGRNDGLRKVTEEWLWKHIGWDRSREHLVMRSQAHSGLQASMFKEEAFYQLKRDANLTDCSFIFMEDDPHVFGMYQKHGIVVRCPEGWEHWLPEPKSGHEPKYRP